jgi:hypothetical protein
MGWRGGSCRDHAKTLAKLSLSLGKSLHLFSAAVASGQMSLNSLSFLKADLVVEVA